MITKIYTLSELEANDKKIAKLVANRQIRRAVKAAKKKSLLTFGQAVPAIIVDAKTVLERNIGIVDFRTGAEIQANEVEKYVVVLDGAHRLAAHLDLLAENKEYTNDFYFMFPLSEKHDVRKLLAEINTCTTPWKGGDYAIGASMMVAEDLPVLSFITELAQKGFSLRAAVEWATLADSITKRVIIQAMNGTVDKRLKDTDNLEYGKRLFYLAAEKFEEGFLRTRTLADWVLKILNATPAIGRRIDTIEKLATFFTNLPKGEAEEIVNMRGSRGGETREALVNKRLDELFQAEEPK